MLFFNKKYVNTHTNRPTGNEFSILYFAYCMIFKKNETDQVGHTVSQKKIKTRNF